MRGLLLHTHTHTPCRATWSVCHFARLIQKKKKKTGKKTTEKRVKKKEMKIRCDFWPLPGSSHAYRWQQSMAHRGRKGVRERLACSHATCYMPHTHTRTHRQSPNVAISMHISPDRDLRHTFISQTHSSCHTQLAPGSISLPCSLSSPYSLLPSPLLLLSFSFLCSTLKVSTTYAILRKMQSMRIDKINKYENLRQNFFVFWQFT